MRPANLIVSFSLLLIACDGTVTSESSDASVAGRTTSRCPGIELADGGCAALSFSSLCSNGELVVLRSDVPDDQTSLELARVVTSACGNTMAQRVASSHDGGELDATGAPLGNRERSLVVAGGSFAQPFVRWLESSGNAPVFDSSQGERLSLSSPLLGQLFTVPMSELSNGRDYFLIEVVRPKGDGPLALVAYGFFQPGTRAAAWYFENGLMGSNVGRSSAWLVMRWTDLDGDGAPGASDEFTLIGSGQ